MKEITGDILTTAFTVQVNSYASSQDLTAGLSGKAVPCDSCSLSHENSRKFKLQQKIKGTQKPSTILFSFPELPKHVNLKYF